MDKGIKIIISGKARVGKDTLADFIVNVFKDKYNKSFLKKAYADSLKEKLMAEFDLSWEQVYGDLKEVPDKRFMKKFKEEESHADGKVWGDKDIYWTPREIMQFIGTDCYREIDDLFWVKQLFKNISDESNLIVSDGRFRSEVDPIVDSGGYHIKVIRDYDGVVNNKTHDSETSLDDDYKVDFKIRNEGDLNDLKQTAEDIVKIIESKVILDKEVNL